MWAAGNGPIPFVLDVVNNIEEQKVFQGKARGRIVTDNWLRVLGAEVSIRASIMFSHFLLSALSKSSIFRNEHFYPCTFSIVCSAIYVCYSHPQTCYSSLFLQPISFLSFYDLSTPNFSIIY